MIYNYYITLVVGVIILEVFLGHKCEKWREFMERQ